ncbi:hypothetical protein DRN67_00475 [Candidatus Micrarchaeota archaeon]|nr:MAG: hypothetical protein DRN67_00475 [Candidatus Micrarchaeota archaeon]
MGMKLGVVQGGMQPGNIMRTMPPLSFHKRKPLVTMPSTKIVYALIDPFFAEKVNLINELERFPAEMGEKDRIRFMKRMGDAKLLMWQNAIMKASENQNAYFMLIPGSSLYPLSGLKKLAERKLGKRFTYVDAFENDLEGRSYELVERLGRGSRILVSMGEYTTRCVIEKSARIAKAMGIKWNRVVVLRRLSVDGEHEEGEFADPLSLPESERIKMLPPDQRKAARRRAGERFERKFVKKAEEAIYGPKLELATPQ